MVLLVYRIFINLILIFSPIILLIRILKKKEDVYRFKEKFCFFSKKKIKKKLVWFHGASVGEISSIIPIVFSLEKNKKIDQILITSSTLSSAKVLEQFKFKKTVHQFFPIDTNKMSENFLNYWKPSLAVFVDSEIWPNMILNLKKGSIPIFLLNARITQRSFKRWKIFRDFSKTIFQCIDKSIVSNQETKNYLKYLGVKNIKSVGNLKFIQNKFKKLTLPEKLRKHIVNKTTWCAASTHKGEEQISINVHKILKKKYSNLLSVIIPRHIDRSKELVELFKENNLKVHCHSWKTQIPKNIDIYLVDTYGETEKFFNLIKVVFVGGSLVNHGGQNPLEPARHGCNILYGPNVNNFKKIYDFLDKIRISKKIQGDRSLYTNIKKLISNKNKARSANKRVKKLGDKISAFVIKEIESSLIK